MAFWPFLVRLCPGISLEAALRAFQTGVVYVLYLHADKLGGFCTVERHGQEARITSLPSDNGCGLGKACLTHVIEWAKKHGVQELVASTNNLNGSSFRYFEKSLGFKRKEMIFALQVR